MTKACARPHAPAGRSISPTCPNPILVPLVTRAENGTNETDNCRHAITGVTAAVPDILINKTADKGSVSEGEELTYTLTVSNVGTANSTAAISVSDTVPSELTVAEISPEAGWDCSGSSGNNVVCNRPDLAIGASTHITIRTTLNSGVTAPFTNTASVIGGGETNANNNTDSVTTAVGGNAIDLQVVSVDDNPVPVNPGQVLTYTAVVTNNGTSDTGPGAVVRVVLPAAGADVPSIGVTASDASGKTFDCVGDFAAGSSTTITAEMTVSMGTPPPSQLLVTVTADPDGAFTESDETNNVMSQTTTISGTVCSGSPCVDLVAVAFGSPIVSILGGGTGIYTAVITNAGTAPVPDSPAWTIEFSYIGIGTLTVAPPAGVSCTPFSALITRCTSVSGSGDPMDLAPGANLTFAVTILGMQPAGGVGILDVTADSTGQVTELDEGNNLAVAVTAIQP